MFREVSQSEVGTQKTYGEMRHEFRTGRNVEDVFFSLSKAHEKINELREQLDALQREFDEYKKTVSE